jgi:Fe-S-cluster containining protein
MFQAVKSRFPQKRYILKSTINGFSRMIILGQDPPEEEKPDWGKCPLLDNEMCSVYTDRPFSCRNLVSEIEYRKKGYAQVPPMVLIINNIFLQYIEQLHLGGFLGNLSDVLTLFSEKEIQDADIGLDMLSIKKSGSRPFFTKNEKFQYSWCRPITGKGLELLWKILVNSVLMLDFKTPIILLI